MPSLFTHALVGLGMSEIWAGSMMSWRFHALAMGLAAAPDLDVLAFSFGIPYGSFFGHRGFFHSLAFALVAGLAIGAATAGWFGQPWWMLGLFFFAVIASHGLLDAFTNGGLGIALLSPFDTARYFFVWQPIQVSPLGKAFFSVWGLRALASEVVWVWLPLAVVVGGTWWLRLAKPG